MILKPSGLKPGLATLIYLGKTYARYGIVRNQNFSTSPHAPFFPPQNLPYSRALASKAPGLQNAYSRLKSHITAKMTSASPDPTLVFVENSEGVLRIFCLDCYSFRMYSGEIEPIKLSMLHVCASCCTYLDSIYTRYASAASWSASSAGLCQRHVPFSAKSFAEIASSAISRTSRRKGSLRISGSVAFWKNRISRSAPF